MLGRINHFLDYLAASKSQELSQSIVRLGLVIVVYLFLLSLSMLFPQQLVAPVLSATTVYFIFTALLLLHISFYPYFIRSRHYLAIVIDMTLLGYGMHVGGIATAFFYGGYLWLVMGNGLRFGQNSLYLSVLFSSISFMAVIIYTPFWQDNILLGIGLMIWLFLLPPYMSKLIRSKDEALLHAQLADHAKTQFLANMSHELRTPLNGIIGYAEMIHEDKVAVEDAHDSAEKIEAAARHLLDLISELLDLASIEAGKMKVKNEVVYLVPLLNEVLPFIESAAREKNIVIKINDISEQPVSADRLRLKQVITNLLSNAIKYNYKEGQVEVYTSLSDNKFIELCVRDSGPGLTAEEQGKLFLPFERLSAESSGIEGAGIGLMITKRLVDLMHGQLKVESEKGKGSCFSVKLLLAS